MRKLSDVVPELSDSVRYLVRRRRQARWQAPLLGHLLSACSRLYQIGLVNREETICVVIRNHYRDWLSEQKYVVHQDDLFDASRDASPDASRDASREASRDTS